MPLPDSDAPKITREEPWGPLRSGLDRIGDALGPKHGGLLFKNGVVLANSGLDLVLDLHQNHKLGDPDKSIPPTTQVLTVERKRGKFIKNPEKAVVVKKKGRL